MEEWSRQLFNKEENLFFQTPFAALQSVAAVLNTPLALSANQHPVITQALKAAECEFTYVDIDFNGAAIVSNDERHHLATDYAGIMPSDFGAIEFWSNGAGFSEDQIQKCAVNIIDLQTLNPLATTSGAVVMCADQKLLSEISRYASLGMQKGHLWNDRIERHGIDGLMSPLTWQYWNEHTPRFSEALKEVQGVCDYYTEELRGVMLINTIPNRYPRVYPFRLAPELFCPKESIFEALSAEGIAVEVPFKPLYRYSAFEGAKLTGCEEFYKAVLALPVHGISMEEAKRIVDTFKSVMERYDIRGCTF